MRREFVAAAAPGQARAGAGGHPCQGVWHAPAGRQPRVGFIATHYEVDFSEHYLAEYLAARGYGMLGWNTRYRGNGAYFALDNALTDIGVGVEWMRREAGVDTVVLIGNSGGASLMGAYQARALDPARGLPAADLFVSLNAHPGRPDVLTSWLDPSVTDEADPLSVDPSLSMFEPGNGPPYDPAFVERYRAAQRARNDRITAWCHKELERLGAGGAFDRVFDVYRTWADLRFSDLSIDPSDRAPGCYFGDPRFANYSPFGLATTNTCRSWLSMWSLADSECRTELHLPSVTVPSLVVQSTEDQGCYPSDARAIFGALGSQDKTLEWMKGDHYLQAPPEGRDQVADLIGAWVDARTK
ncbi:MAG TPA: hypothetical protein VFH45_00540 [Acidimicrobiales bacterium]|nr:hypothetical protein [Acidimicrobiales bacterium]